MDFKGFKLDVEQGLKLDNFAFTPGESTRVKTLVSFAGSMAGLEFLPGEIKDVPFIITFTEEGGCRMFRAENPGKYVDFEFSQIDDVLQAVDNLVAQAIDSHTLRPRPSAGARSMDTFPDTFDGAS